MVRSVYPRAEVRDQLALASAETDEARLDDRRVVELLV
jgi:hypothetical protein